MGMRANDRAEHRYRSRSQLYMSSSGPRSMRGYEVLTRAPSSAARAWPNRACDEFVTFSVVWSFVHGHACE